MVIFDGAMETEKYIDQFYASQNYQSRLEAIQYLISVSDHDSFSKTIFNDALRDFCSQVKVYVLQNYDFPKEYDEETEKCLVDIAKNDEKVQLRALALTKLAELSAPKHYDLFFSTSLLKSSKESAAGLRGLYQVDKEKAYQMAKFRAESSSGDLDLAIAEIFLSEGDVEDINFCRKRIQARNKFNKIELVRIYLKILGKSKMEEVVKSHIYFICNDISATGNTELIQLLIMELHHFITSNKGLLENHQELFNFINKTIDLLLEKDYAKMKRGDPFGPL